MAGQCVGKDGKPIDDPEGCKQEVTAKEVGLNGKVKMGIVL